MTFLGPAGRSRNDVTQDLSGTVQRNRPGPLRALLLLGSSSVVTIIAGMFSAKIAALMIGPEGIGLMAIVLTIVSLANTVITAGVGPTLVRFCGADAAHLPNARHGGWVRAARQIVLGTSLTVVAISLIVTRNASASLLGANSKQWWLFGVALAAASYSWSQIQLMTLVAHHLVSVTARFSAAIAFVSPLVNAVLFALYGINGVVPGAIVANFVIVGLITITVRRTVDLGDWRSGGPSMSVRRRRLVREGLPLVPAAMIGGLATLAVLLIVDHKLSLEEAGFYRAASTVSIAYVSFLTASVVQDFFPRLSRTVDDSALFASTCDQQIRLILYLAAPVVVAINVALPLIVPLLYTSEFAPAVDVLEWQIPADLLRLTTSILATALLVRAGSLAQLIPETLAAVTLVALSVLGLDLFGFVGLGLGYLTTFLVYLAILLAALRRSGYSPSIPVMRHLFIALGCALVAPTAVAVTGVDRSRLIGIPIAVALVVSAGHSLGKARLMAFAGRGQATRQM